MKKAKYRFLKLTSLLVMTPFWFGGCAPTERLTKEELEAMVPKAVSRADTEKLFIVDCLLPPEVRQLGQKTIFLSPRLPIKTSELECRIRGGEYVAYDRANYETATKVWQAQAEQGDPEAQTYMGQIYEKGLGTDPDYVFAAQWYRRAAEQGYSRAQINLGYLYEQGLGVETNVVTAMNWYRKASGLPDELEFVSSAEIAAQEQELEELREEVSRLQQEAESLKQQLNKTGRKLSTARKESANLQNEIEESRRRIEMLEEEGVSPEREADLQRLQRELERKTANVEKQSLMIARLEQEAEGYRVKLNEVSTAQAQILRGPTIEIFEPPFSAMRRIPTVRLRSPIKRKEIVGRVLAPAGLEAFNVNNRSIDVTADGLFRVLLDIVEPETTVKLVAIDKKGRQAALDFVVVTEPSRPAPPTIAGINFGTYHALIIGNNQYRHLPRLETAINDATKTERILREKYGFETTLLLNADRHSVLLAFHQLRQRLGEQDNLLIYYAGHGDLDRINDSGYWLPVDAAPDDPVNWISNLAITELINALPAKHVMIIADSCYSGTMSRAALPRVDVTTRKNLRDKWLKLMAKSRSRTVLTSGGIQPVLDLDLAGGEHSVFAHAFLAALDANDDILQGYNLYTKVAEQVSRRAAHLGITQTPEYAPIKHAGHETGQFFFVPAG